MNESEDSRCYPMSELLEDRNFVLSLLTTMYRGNVDLAIVMATDLIKHWEECKVEGDYSIFDWKTGETLVFDSLPTWNGEEWVVADATE